MGLWASGIPRRMTNESGGTYAEKSCESDQGQDHRDRAGAAGLWHHGFEGGHRTGSGDDGGVDGHLLLLRHPARKEVKQITQEILHD